MISSAPIPQIALACATRMRDDVLREECIALLQNIYCDHYDTGSDTLNKSFERFVNELIKNDSLLYISANFVSYYFELMDEQELNDYFRQICLENQDKYTGIEKFYSGYLAGIFTTALIGDKHLITSNVKIPEDIKSAIEYIEKYNFKVHLTDDKTRT